MRNTFRTIIMLMVLVLILPMFTPTAADAAAGTSVFVNGNKIVYAQAPIVEKGVTLVSARETIEALGMSFSWDQANKRITGSSEAVTIALQMGSRLATANGVTLILGAPAVERNGRILIPLRFLLDSVGASMENKGNVLSIKLASNKNSKYYTGLPLEITNTAVKNLSGNTLTVNYVQYVVNLDNSKILPLNSTLTLAPGQKAPFEHATAKVGENIVIDYEEYMYFGRAVQSVTIKDKEIASEGFKYADQYYNSLAYLDSLSEMYTDILTDIETKIEKQRKQELAANKNVPLRIDDATVTYGTLNYPEAKIGLTNLSHKRIISFEISFSCLDPFNDPAYRSYTKNNRFVGVMDNVSMLSNNKYYAVWDLFSYSDTAKITNIRIDKVAFSDGTVWKRKK